MFRLERWSAGALLGTWAGWWAALIGVSIGPGLLRALRLGREPGMHGTMSATFDGGRLQFIVNNTADAAGNWAFSTSMAAALAWIAIPPLVLWLLWLFARPSRGSLPAPSAPMLANHDTEAGLARRTTDERVERRR